MLRVLGLGVGGGLGLECRAWGIEFSVRIWSCLRLNVLGSSCLESVQALKSVSFTNPFRP